MLEQSCRVTLIRITSNHPIFIELHDYQLDRICMSLDGHDVLAQWQLHISHARHLCCIQGSQSRNWHAHIPGGPTRTLQLLLIVCYLPD